MLRDHDKFVSTNEVNKKTSMRRYMKVRMEPSAPVASLQKRCLRRFIFQFNRLTRSSALRACGRLRDEFVSTIVSAWAQSPATISMSPHQTPCDCADTHFVRAGLDTADFIRQLDDEHSRRWEVAESLPQHHHQFPCHCNCQSPMNGRKRDPFLLSCDSRRNRCALADCGRVQQGGNALLHLRHQLGTTASFPVHSKKLSPRTS